MGAVLFGAVVLVALAAINGLIVLLNRSGAAGSLLAAFLFLPQFVMNLALALAVIVGVLVPVAIATENVGASQAVGRLLNCVQRDTSRLL